MYFADSSAALEIAAEEYLTLWCSSNRDFRPRRMDTVSPIDGSVTSIFGIGVKARDLSRTHHEIQYRLWRQCISAPEERAGFNRFEASMGPT